MNCLVSPRLKKLFAITSAFVFLFGAVGYYLAFSLADEVVKADAAGQMRMATTEKRIIRLSFSKNELRNEVRFTDKNELVYRGEHYDVVSRKEDGAQVILNCYHDERETSLFSWFHKTLDHHNTSSSAKSSARSLTPDWLLASQDLSFVSVTEEFIPSHFHGVQVSADTEIPTPPPNA